MIESLQIVRVKSIFSQIDFQNNKNKTCCIFMGLACSDFFNDLNNIFGFIFNRNPKVFLYPGILIYL